MKTKLRSKYEIFPHEMLYARFVTTRRDAVPFAVSGGGKKCVPAQASRMPAFLLSLPVDMELSNA